MDNNLIKRASIVISCTVQLLLNNPHCQKIVKFLGAKFTYPSMNLNHIRKIRMKIIVW